MGESDHYELRAAGGRRGEPGPGNPGGGQPAPSWLAGLVERYPHLRRQPHPVVAHFPITFMLAAGFFSVLYLLTKVPSFETTAFHCLGGGVLTTPACIVTGVLTQRLNYPDPDPTLVLEKRLSFLLWAAASGAFIWRLLDPEVLRNLHGLNSIYLLSVLALTPLVSVISFFGGLLTFPLEGENSSGGAAVPGRPEAVGRRGRPPHKARPTDISA